MVKEEEFRFCDVEGWSMFEVVLDCEENKSWEEVAKDRTPPKIRRTTNGATREKAMAVFIPRK